jgi:segregation and condensation protein B
VERFCILEEKKLDPLILHIESLIFAAHQPIGFVEIRKTLEDAMDYTPTDEEINSALLFLSEKYRSPDYAFEMAEINNGYIFLTKAAFHNTVSSFLKISSPKRLSKAALETLAIIAYKQPVTSIATILSKNF